MGEAKTKEAAKSLVHRVLFGWIERGIVIWILRQGQGKGMQHARTLARTIAALKADGDWDYLDEPNTSLVHLPGERKLLIAPIPSLLQQLKQQELIKNDSELVAVSLMLSEKRQCPDEVLTFTSEMIDFILKQMEEAPVRNALLERIAESVGDLEDARAGRYHLPEELEAGDSEEQAATAS
jgi:hypothetical protein